MKISFSFDDIERDEVNATCDFVKQHHPEARKRGKKGKCEDGKYHVFLTTKKPPKALKH